MDHANVNKFKLIGAAIDACCKVRGAKDTPYVINDLLKKSAAQHTFDQIFEYSSDGHDVLQLQGYFTQLATSTKQSLVENKLPIIIGGDHSCAIGSWSGVSDYLANKNQSFGIIWVDAHMDSHTPETSPSGNIHGMPIASLFGYGYPELTKILNDNPKLDPTNIILIGIRSFEDGEAKLLATLGVKIYYNHDVNTQTIKSLIHKSWQELDARVDKIGFSLDLDGFDPKDTPGVGTKEPEGVNFNEFISSISELNLAKLIAVEVTEGNPHLDPTGKTMECITTIITEFIRYGIK